MTSETIKVLLMITLFCGLQASLHWPRLAISRTTKRWRRAMTLSLSAGIAHVYAGRLRRDAGVGWAQPTLRLGYDVT